ncbi:MAG: redox-regulated ATPase YchF [Anaerolineae bacterium]|jgi:GTP-binding protein YchF|nr:redox-regulated ATPase YchF [Anaerolineae bacterium]MCZ7553445.1 redox-regulated ATPase YchF [Anaerolineales bacterium]
MALNIGIIGLPNVGKSTLFNVLSGAQHAAVANYPFCTIQPNRAIVPLPDPRLERLAELTHAPKAIHAAVEFVDLAGLVKGAHKGEGLGNQFLSHIRDTSALLHVVRCFEDPNVVHVSAQLDPADDIETVQVELALADLEQVERKIARLESALKADKKLAVQMELCQSLRGHLAQGRPARQFSPDAPADFAELDHELRLLTAKPLILAANIAEAALAGGSPQLETVRRIAREQGYELVVVCAALEAELLEMEPAERQEYLALSGVADGGLVQVIRASFAMLDLISFFTFNEKEARAWNVPRGTLAPKAAGAIHTDFERGFIRAEVIPFETFAQYGGSAAVKTAGLMRLEGKEYPVQDGDVIYFRFNV